MDASHLRTRETGKSKEAAELDKNEGGSLPRHSSLSNIPPELLLHICTLTAPPLHHHPKPYLNSSLQRNATTYKPQKGMFRGLRHGTKNQMERVGSPLQGKIFVGDTQSKYPVHVAS